MDRENMMSELDDLFGTKTDEGKEGDGTPTEPVFPESAEIPKDLQGQPMTPENVLKLAKMSQSALSEMTKAKQDLAELTKTIEAEKETEPPASGDPNVSPEMASTMQTLAEMKLEQVINGDKFAEQWKEEIANTLQAVPASDRMKPETIKSAVAYVKGLHLDDILKESTPTTDEAPKTPSPSLESDAVGAPSVGGAAPKTPSVGDEVWKSLSDSEKSSLLAWADGDKEKLKAMLSGGQ